MRKRKKTTHSSKRIPTRRRVRKKATHTHKRSRGKRVTMLHKKAAYKESLLQEIGKLSSDRIKLTKKRDKKKKTKRISELTREYNRLCK